jgi:hypothetical protein
MSGQTTLAPLLPSVLPSAAQYASLLCIVMSSFTLLVVEAIDSPDPRPAA